MHVAFRAHRLQHVEVARRKPGQPEQGEAGRKLQDLGFVAEPLAGVDQALRRARPPDPGPQQAPQLHLPVSLALTLCPLGPAPHHFGPVHRVAVEEVGHVADAREPLRLRDGLRVADVLGQRRQPGLVEVRLDDFEQRPDRPLRQPGVRIRLNARRQRQGAVHHRAGKREVDVGAHTVVPSWRGTQVRRQALRQPALDAAGGHRDHLGHHGIVGGARQRDLAASPRASRPVRIDGRAAPRQSTSAVFASDWPGQPPCWGGLRADYALPVLAPPSGSATMVGCVNASSGSSGW